MRILVAGLALFSMPVWASAPVISRVDPAQLGTAGGTITLTGSDFASDAVVKVGGYPCDNLTVVSATQATCTAPTNIARKSDVTLLNADGGMATLAEAVEYTGAPGFALLQQRVFVRFGVNSQGVTVVMKCTGCHGGAKPDGKLDMKDYSQVILRVVAGDPNGSLLYQQVTNGKMPPPERQPALKPEEQQAISDWIQAGAANN